MLPVGGGRDYDYAHSGHDGAGGVGAVSGGGDQDHVAMRVAAVVMIGADDSESREFALRSGVGLE